MATIVTNTATLISFNLNLSGFGLVTFDLEGSGMVLNGATHTFTGGTATRLTINTFNGTFSDDSLGTITSGTVLPNNSTLSLEEFLIDVGADTFGLNAPGSMQLFGDFNSDMTLNGTSGNDTIQAGAGDDLLFGGAEDDVLYGGTGTNTVYGGSGDDRLESYFDFGFGGSTGPFDQTLFGGSGSDDIYGSSGDDELFGGGGRDFLSGYGGDDSLFGGKTKDFLYGGVGRDDIFGGKGGDYISGGLDFRYTGADSISDNDFVEGGRGADQIFGGLGKDTLYGERGSDFLEGGRGADKLYGGGAKDVLSSIYSSYGENDADEGGSSKAKDRMFGGSSADVFVFTSSQEGRLIIKDFKEGKDLLQMLPDGVGDFLDPVEVDAVITAKSQYKTFMKDAVQKKYGVLYEGERGSIRIDDLQLDELSADNFLTAINGGMIFD